MVATLNDDEKECLRIMIKQHRKREARFEKFKTSFIGAVATLLAGGLVTGLVWLGEKVLELWQHGHH